MNVTYTAPNRSHHYPYAVALHRAGALEAFVSGFPRWSPRAPLPELGARLMRRDLPQLAYLASLRFRARFLSPALAHWSKCYLDRCSRQPAGRSSVFMAYNGCGLHTFRALRGSRTLRILEVVNSHVTTQEEILADEYQHCGLPYQPIYGPEKRRRLAEYEEADYILCPSEFVRRSFLSRGFSPERLIKNAYGFTRPGTGSGTKTRQEGFQILYVGSINVRKGLRYLGEAFRELRVPGKQLKLVGPLTRETGLENLSLPEGVAFTGSLKGEELANAYAAADVFVLPSVEEGLALVMAEALSFGLPVIATDHTGADDLFTDGREGFIVPSGQAGGIADRLQTLAGSRELREQMSAAARRRAAALGGWDASGENLVRLLQSLPAS